MLFDVPRRVRPGATLPLTFAFADGTTLHGRCPRSRRRTAEAAMPGMTD